MKECKKCGKSKSIDEYYIHKGMADGHLSFCKECVRERVSAYGKTPRGRAVDRKRNQKMARILKRREYCRTQGKKWKKKRRAQSTLKRAVYAGKVEKKPCEVCGTTEWVEGHHSDYNKPLDVMWLCSLHHKEWHRNNDYIPPK